MNIYKLKTWSDKKLLIIFLFRCLVSSPPSSSSSQSFDLATFHQTHNRPKRKYAKLFWKTQNKQGVEVKESLWWQLSLQWKCPVERQNQQWCGGWSGWNERSETRERRSVGDSVAVTLVRRKDAALGSDKPFFCLRLFKVFAGTIPGKYLDNILKRHGSYLEEILTMPWQYQTINWKT